MKQSILKHLDALIACDTQNPPRRIDTDHEIFAYLSSTLESAGGFSIETSDHGDGHVNFFAVRGNPDVLFNAHLDTVQIGTGWSHDPLKLTVQDNRAYGRGVCDIKGAAAVLLAIAETSDVPLALLFSTDEEGANSCCVTKFTETITKDDYTAVIVAEPTQCRAVLGHRGYLSVLGEFVGKPGHSSERRGLTDNAIHQASAWANAAVDYAKKHDEQGSGICFNIGTISGGSGSNVIAGDAHVHWSARISPGGDSSSTLTAITGLTAAAKIVEWNARFHGSPLPAFGFNEQAARAFCEEHEIPVGDPVSFWTEASIFSAAGLPAIVLGPGNIEQAHSADEWIDLDQLWLVAAIYQRLCQEA